MRARLLQLLEKIPGSWVLLKAWRAMRTWLLLRPHGSAESIFTHFYHKRIWKGGGDETVSGSGSTFEYTANIRKEIPLLIERLGVKTMLDAPCGDFNWFRHIELPKGVQYIGGDIVRPLVARNNELYGSANTSFRFVDITQDSLPDVDLWLCRACLFHLSDEDVFKAVDNFLRSNIPYLLTTVHPECKKNMDIPTGLFRLLNLELAPFNFPPARFYMDDWIKGHPMRQLALWHREDLIRALERDPGKPVPASA